MNLLELNKESISVLSGILESCGDESTAYDIIKYKENVYKTKLFGHCACIALFIKKYYKGNILSGKIDGGSHYWNLLPDGRQFDFTSKQYDGDGINPVLKEFRKQNLRTNNKRAIAFENKVLDKIKELGHTV